jgi:membrane protease subunit (stomatin/prohibitin family)
VLDVASRYTELGEALLPLINPVVSGKYGIQIGSFIVENVSVPPEVEQAIDKRSSMAAVGNLNDFVKYQMAKGMEAPGGGGPAGMASELAVGFAIAQQIMQQQGVPGAPGCGRCGGCWCRRCGRRVGAAPDLLSPADVAKKLGVPEADRDDDHLVGRAGGQENRHELPHHARSARPVPSLPTGRMLRIDRTKADGRGTLLPSSSSLRPSSLLLVLVLMADEVTAREKFACPACGAQAEWSPAKQKLICPFCGTESPYQINPSSGAIEEVDLVKTLRELPDSAAWLAGGETQRTLSELPGGDGVRPVARRAELRILRVAGAGGLQGNQGSDQPAEPVAVSGRGYGRARADPAVVREQMVRSRKTESARAGRHGARRLPAVLDLRRAGHVSVAR